MTSAILVRCSTNWAMKPRWRFTRTHPRSNQYHCRQYLKAKWGRPLKHIRSMALSVLQHQSTSLSWHVTIVLCSPLTNWINYNWTMQSVNSDVVPILHPPSLHTTTNFMLTFPSVSTMAINLSQLWKQLSAAMQHSWQDHSLPFLSQPTLTSFESFTWSMASNSPTKNNFHLTTTLHGIQCIKGPTVSQKKAMTLTRFLQLRTICFVTLFGLLRWVTAPAALLTALQVPPMTDLLFQFTPYLSQWDWALFNHLAVLLGASLWCEQLGFSSSILIFHTMEQSNSTCISAVHTSKLGECAGKCTKVVAVRQISFGIAIATEHVSSFTSCLFAIVGSVKAKRNSVQAQSGNIGKCMANTRPFATSHPK